MAELKLFYHVYIAQCLHTQWSRISGHFETAVTISILLITRKAGAAHFRSWEAKEKVVADQ